jgi:hypothetical protein
LEKQSTNVVLNSEDFSGATWLNEDIIVSTNQTISPDGTQNADKLIANTTTLDHSIYQTSSGSTRTFSIYAKAGEYNYIFLGSNNNSASDGAFFNLSNGTISQNTSGLTASIESVGNGWYRCIVSSTSWPTIYTILCLSTNGTSLGFTGNNTSGIYVWGCQVENSSYPTSYIPTTSASATRVADACVKTGISSLIGQTSGTVFWDIQVDIASAATLENIFNLDAGSFSDTIYIAFQGSLSRIVAEMYVTGVAQASFNLTSITAGRYKMAIGYANNNTAFFINGTQVGTTDTTCSVPAMSRLQMGSGVLGPSDGKVNQAVLFTTRLSNSELASLTSL